VISRVIACTGGAFGGDFSLDLDIVVGNRPVLTGTEAREWRERRTPSSLR
jgi:hypothetical protein